MIDDKGRKVKEAGPSTPVEILGLNDVPNAGEILVVTENDKEAKHLPQPLYLKIRTVFWRRSSLNVSVTICSVRYSRALRKNCLLLLKQMYRAPWKL